MELIILPRSTVWNAISKNRNVETTYPILSNKNAYAIALTNIIINFLYCNFSFTVSSVLILNVSYNKRILNAVKIMPRPIGKIFGPTDEPYALSEIFWLSTKKSIPINKNAIPATVSNFLFKIIPPNRKGDY